MSSNAGFNSNLKKPFLNIFHYKRKLPLSLQGNEGLWFMQGADHFSWFILFFLWYISSGHACGGSKSEGDVHVVGHMLLGLSWLLCFAAAHGLDKTMSEALEHSFTLLTLLTILPFYPWLTGSQVQGQIAYLKFSINFF